MNFTMKHHSESGFMAIFSVMIISALLISGAVALGQQAFSVQKSLERLETRRQAKLLAQSCMDIAKLKLLKQKDYALKPEDKSIRIGEYSCEIISLQPAIKTQATVEGSNVELENN